MSAKQFYQSITLLWREYLHWRVVNWGKEEKVALYRPLISPRIGLHRCRDYRQNCSRSRLKLMLFSQRRSRTLSRQTRLQGTINTFSTMNHSRSTQMLLEINMKLLKKSIPIPTQTRRTFQMTFCFKSIEVICKWIQSNPGSPCYSTVKLYSSTQQEKEVICLLVYYLN